VEELAGVCCGAAEVCRAVRGKRRPRRRMYEGWQGILRRGERYLPGRGGTDTIALALLDASQMASVEAKVSALAKRLTALLTDGAGAGDAEQTKAVAGSPTCAWRRSGWCPTRGSARPPLPHGLLLLLLPILVARDGEAHGALDRLTAAAGRPVVHRAARAATATTRENRRWSRVWRRLRRPEVRAWLSVNAQLTGVGFEGEVKRGGGGEGWGGGAGVEGVGNIRNQGGREVSGLAGLRGPPIERAFNLSASEPHHTSGAREWGDCRCRRRRRARRDHTRARRACRRGGGREVQDVGSREGLRVGSWPVVRYYSGFKFLVWVSSSPREAGVIFCRRRRRRHD